MFNALRIKKVVFRLFLLLAGKHYFFQSKAESVRLEKDLGRRKKHIQYYGKAKLGKTFEDISLFLTTKNNIQFAKNNINIWQKVE